MTGINTMEKLENVLNKCDVEYEKINIDEYGFSRTYKCKALDTEFIIEWFHNLSTIKVGGFEFWTDGILVNSGYPCIGSWIEFIWQGKQTGVHLRIK